MIRLLLQWYFYYCNHTSTIAIILLLLHWLILTLQYLNYRDFWLLMCFLHCYDMRQTCVSCVLQCVSLQSNTLRVLSGFQRIGKYQKVLHSTKKYWNVSQSFASEETASIVGVGGQGWHLYSLLDTVPYSHHIPVLRGSHVDTSILCCALLCSHVDISILCSGADDELLTAAAADSHWHCKQ